MAETTDPAANPTAGAQANPTQAATPGASTDLATQSQVTTTPNTQADQRIAAALKTLEDAGMLGKDILTKAQHDGHMGAARRQWQTETQQAAERATQEAQAQALQEQGQFKPLYEQAQVAIQQHEATIKERDTVIASLSSHVNADIEAVVKNLPPVLKELDPGADNLSARMDWIAKIKKHPEALGQLGGQTRVYGNGQNQRPVGARTPADITPPVSRRQF